MGHCLVCEHKSFREKSLVPTRPLGLCLADLLYFCQWQPCHNCLWITITFTCDQEFRIPKSTQTFISLPNAKHKYWFETCTEGIKCCIIILWGASKLRNGDQPDMPAWWLAALWLPQALNQAVRRQCTCVGYVRAKQWARLIPEGKFTPAHRSGAVGGIQAVGE